jgi:thioredoxin 2
LILSCPACGVKNRVPASHAADQGRCGKCKAELPPLSSPVEADPALFDEVVGSARVPVLVDVWARWCGPCKAAAPQVERTAREMAGRAVVLKVDSDAHPELTGRLHVQGLPTFLVFKDGREVLRQPGYATADQMTAWLQEAR